MEVGIVFVEAESEENIGALARVMANFDFYRLILVNPQANYRSEKTKIVARERGWEVIKNAEIVDKIEEALKKFDVCYGTTGVSAQKGSMVLRNPLTPEELAERIWRYEGSVGLFFGRESIGFTNEELELFDAVITIPASERYPVLNVTHAAAIIFYELFKRRKNPVRRVFKLANRKEKEVIIKFASELIEELPIQDYRKPVMKRVIRNLIGKALITKREYSVLAGIFRLARDSIKK
jgi:TrmH family RNA methyltransferase